MPAPTQKLRVYVTYIGFTSWAVAAPSQKAALAAWDVRENLFATGAAKQTTDARAVALAMKTPGKPVALDRPETKAEMGRIIRLDDHRQKRAEAVATKRPAPPKPATKPQGGLKLQPRPRPDSKAKPETKAKPALKAKSEPKAPPKPPRPKPDRSRLTAAEDELRIFQKRAIRDRSSLLREREALDAKAKMVEARIEAEEKRLKSALERERTRYESLSDD